MFGPETITAPCDSMLLCELLCERMLLCGVLAGIDVSVNSLGVLIYEFHEFMEESAIVSAVSLFQCRTLSKYCRP